MGGRGMGERDGGEKDGGRGGGERCKEGIERHKYQIKQDKMLVYF